MMNDDVIMIVMNHSSIKMSPTSRDEPVLYLNIKDSLAKKTIKILSLCSSKTTGVTKTHHNQTENTQWKVCTP